MKTKYCTCTSRDLFHYGCRCSYRLPRTLPINIIIAELGFKIAWEVVEKEMIVIEEKRCRQMRKPDDLNSLMVLMWDIESYSISLHDDIARELEDKWRSKFKAKSLYDYNF